MLFGLTVWPLTYALPSTFRTAGDAGYPMKVGILSMFICRIVLAYVLGIYPNMGVLGAWFAMFIDWIVKTGFFIYHYFSKKWIHYKTV